MKVSDEDFSYLESLIRWSIVDPLKEKEFVDTLANKPYLAQESDSDGQTLLMIAAEEANAKLVQFLCGLRADVNAVSALGTSPITSLVLGAPHKGKTDPRENERVKIAKELICKGADVNKLIHSGCNALHLAIIYARVNLVRIFLQVGASPFSRLCDPPSEENAIELAQSGRFQGSEEQRQEILTLLSNIDKNNIS